MTTLLFAHDSFGRHETPPGHPERPDRYAAVEHALSAASFADLVRREPPIGAREIVERAHPATYVDAIDDARPRTPEDRAALDPDTHLGPSTWEAALRAVGGAAAGVDAVFAGEADNAFVASRPPGHHAEPARAMGFCGFNTAVAAALHARAAHGATRVAVVDFDVHHGNGTEAAFWSDENAFFASSHEYPQYPGTGRETDRGAFDNVANAPLPTGTDGDGLRRAWGEKLLPALDDFDPDIIVVSAGFAAHRADPLGGLELTAADFGWLTREIVAVARARCGGRVVSVLEGGYDLNGLGASVASHVGALMGLDGARA
ncbi:MAG: histone deacetylase family protein [Parvularculaceae bacterium]